jgi:hypothetical protein
VIVDDAGDLLILIGSEVAVVVVGIIGRGFGGGITMLRKYAAITTV